MNTKNLPIITKEQFNKIPRDYRGIYEDFDKSHPHLKGNKTAFTCYITGKSCDTSLSIEGLHFTII